MFLKRIEIIGFKSFAQKTVLDFSKTDSLGGKKSGITAIVGPNGSGKSNIVDALRWALGEQSMKNLRGKKTLDVIFAGSDKKARLGSAQVTLFLDNTSHKVAVDFSEVAITRRIFRNGESEYLINGSLARLLDVVDLLAGAGIGQHSYCLVNQGMADRILNASVLERRSIIEEAAGVKEYQLKKERSERKLKITQQNLERVGSLLLEIEPHLKNLKRQNQKLENSRIYREKLTQKRKELFSFLFFDLENKKKFLKEKEEKLIKKNKLLKEETELNLAVKKSAELNGKNYREEIFSLEQIIRQKQNQMGVWERDIFLLEGKISLEKEKMKNFNLAEIIPVDLVFVKKNLQRIQKLQKDFLKKIEQATSLKDLEMLKQEAQKVENELIRLERNVTSGKVERKKTSDKLVYLKEASLKNIEEITLEKIALEKKKEVFLREIIEKKKLLEKLIFDEQEDKKKMEEREKRLREKAAFIERFRNELNQIKIELARVETRREDLLKRIFQEAGWEEKDLLSFRKESLAIANIDINRWETDIARLRFLVDQTGAVDESVIEEYKEVKARFEFLTKESEDLKEAIKNLKKIIKEMDKKIKVRFEETFGFINKKFQEYFVTIFGGGKAELKLVKVKNGSTSLGPEEDVSDLEIEEKDKNSEGIAEEETPDVFGIEIVAVPKGKKINSLGMLSGGERALTSLALLFAVIAHNPPPFAVLDEVEAALDEANSARFSRIIRQLSEKTQFILITHNRQTMKEASLLYGVTMSDDGVSKLLSVKLDQVDEKGKIKK